MRGGADVTLVVQGKNDRYRAVAIASQPAQIRAALTLLFREFPQDAPYYDVVIGRDGKPRPEDLHSAAENTIMVEARRLD
jgi:hypothetical protein